MEMTKFEDIAKECSEHLKKYGWCVVRDFISKDVADSLSEDFELTAMLSGSPDELVPDCNAIYNHLPLVRMLVHKTPIVSALYGGQVLPTYTYARHYKNSCKLPRHIDRPSCEISFTVALRSTHDWPIKLLDFNKQEQSVQLEAGDALMYLGTRVEHWREEYEGDDHIQAFIHYVDANGMYAGYYFDRNPHNQ